MRIILFFYQIKVFNYKNKVTKIIIYINDLYLHLFYSFLASILCFAIELKIK